LVWSKKLFASQRFSVETTGVEVETTGVEVQHVLPQFLLI
jgi:hypothetical protein